MLAVELIYIAIAFFEKRIKCLEVFIPTIFWFLAKFIRVVCLELIKV